MNYFIVHLYYHLIYFDLIHVDLQLFFCYCTGLSTVAKWLVWRYAYDIFQLPLIKMSNDQKKKGQDNRIIQHEIFALTLRRRITTGFTPAIISLANSSSVIHANLLSIQNYKKQNKINKWCNVWKWLRWSGKRLSYL